MFSLFTELSSSRKTTIQNENNVTTRKPALSTRKPLQDYKVHVNQEPTTSVKQKVTTQTVYKEKQIENDIFLDYCSYKDVEDTYEDLISPELILGEDILNGIISAFSRTNLRDVDPVELVLERPKPVDISFDLHDPDFMNDDDIAAILNVELELNEPLVPFDDLL